MNLKIILYAIFLLMTQLVISQTDMRDGRHYFKYSMTSVLTECNIDGTPVNPGKRASAYTELMKKDWIFVIEAEIGDDYIIQIAQFTDGSPKSTTQNSKTWQDNNSENIYYKLSKAQYKSNAERMKKKFGFVVGASTTLFRIRPGNNKDDEDKISSEFGNDFNIGVTAGWRITPWQNKEVSLSVVGGVSFSSIKVTPQTTRNFISSEASQGCITFSGGLIIEIEKFQISGFVGIDAMSGEIGENWIYRNRPWIGLGFGYEIFEEKKEAKN